MFDIKFSKIYSFFKLEEKSTFKSISLQNWEAKETYMQIRATAVLPSFVTTHTHTLYSTHRFVFPYCKVQPHHWLRHMGWQWSWGWRCLTVNKKIWIWRRLTAVFQKWDFFLCQRSKHAQNVLTNAAQHEPEPKSTLVKVRYKLSEQS